jgi:leader peptidase (prepilin peptidase) / N-methyltransferase
MIDSLLQLSNAPLPFQGLVVFTFGLLVGSFANVCIYRMPQEKSVVFPGSHCTSCQTPIRLFDNIPILSYLILGGKCRHCKAGISWIYPFIELITALLLTAGFFQFGWSWKFAIFFILGPTLVIITAIDIEHRIIPNLITLPGMLFGLAGGIYLEGLWPSVIGFISGAGLFLFIGEVYYRLRGEVGMGMGDVKYIAGAGALLGWQKTFLVIFIAAFLGSIVGLAGMLNQRLNGMSQIPFGPFLAAGTLVAFFWGDELIFLYLRSMT